jgi:hypothetical protein
MLKSPMNCSTDPYYHSCREFSNLINLNDFVHPTAYDLITIHDKRVDAFRKSADAPRRFLKDDVMLRAANLADGKPGLWLRQLERAFERFARDPGWNERDWDWYMQVFEDIIVEYQKNNPVTTKVLIDAMDKKLVSVAAEKVNLYGGTPFDEVFWVDSYEDQNSLSLVRLAFELDQWRKMKVQSVRNLSQRP